MPHALTRTGPASPAEWSTNVQSLISPSNWLKILQFKFVVRRSHQSFFGFLRRTTQAKKANIFLQFFFLLLFHAEGEKMCTSFVNAISNIVCRPQRQHRPLCTLCVWLVNFSTPINTYNSSVGHWMSSFSSTQHGEMRVPPQCFCDGTPSSTNRQTTKYAHFGYLFGGDVDDDVAVEPELLKSWALGISKCYIVRMRTPIDSTLRNILNYVF